MDRNISSQEIDKKHNILQSGTVSFSRDIYREKFKNLLKRIEITLAEYTEIRGKVLNSPRGVDTATDLQSESSSKEDLFSSLLQELNIDEEPGNIRGEETKKTEQNMPLPGILKKITDKEKFKQCIESVKTCVETYGNLVMNFYAEAYHQTDISEDMEISDLRDIIIGVYKGIVPMITLEQKLTALYNKNESFLARLSDFPQDGELLDLKENLHKQKKTFLEINAYFEDHDKRRLVKALEEIEKTSLCLVRANELVSQKEVEVNLVICFRCSGKNPPGVQFCKICKAVLPFSDASVSSIEVSDTGEIMDKLAAEIKNEDVKYFKSLMGKFLNGNIEKTVLRDYMDKFSNKIVSTKKNFERILRPFIIKNADIKELKQFMDEFLLVFDDFYSSLTEGAKFFDDDNKEHLKKCFARLVNADGNMKEIMKKVKICMEEHVSIEDSSTFKTTRLSTDFIPE